MYVAGTRTAPEPASGAGGAPRRRGETTGAMKPVPANRAAPGDRPVARAVRALFPTSCAAIGINFWVVTPREPEPAKKAAPVVLRLQPEEIAPAPASVSPTLSRKRAPDTKEPTPAKVG